MRPKSGRCTKGILTGATVACLAAFAVSSAAASVFYWVPEPETTTGYALKTYEFDDSANWSLSKDGYENPNGLVPGKDDTISGDKWPSVGTHPYYYNFGGFDLKGSTRTIAGYSGSAGAWHCTRIDVTNGTLIVKDPMYAYYQSRAYYVMNGATLIYPATDAYRAVAPSGLCEIWDIAAGGRGEIYAKITLVGHAKGYVTYTVHEGGVMVFNPGGLSTGSTNAGEDGVVFENFGTMLIPNGVNWDARSYSNEVDKDRMQFRQRAGTMLLGGDFRKTARNFYLPGEMKFILAGGTLEVTNSVSFFTADAAKDESKGWGDQVFAEMPAGASATVDVKIGSVIDMTPFTYGDGAELTKSGPGRMVLSSLPGDLTVAAGEVVFMRPIAADDSISVAAGAKVVFGAAGNVVESLPNAASIDFAIGESVPVGSTIVSSSDPVLLQTICGNIAMPPDSEGVPAVVDGRILLRGRSPLVVIPVPRTLVVGDEPSGNGYHVVGPEGASAFLTGVPVYGFGGYAAGGAAGSYVLSVSGLASESFDIEYATDVLTVVEADAGRTFYWKGGTDFAAYWDTNNWSYASDFSGVATRLPCSLDRIWCKTTNSPTYWYNGCYDLGGGTYEIDTMDGTGASAWRQYYFGLTNGTMKIMRVPNYFTIGIQQSPRFEIFSGATLIYPYGTTQTSASPSGLQEQWIIHSGGRGEIYCYDTFGSDHHNEPFCQVEEGGVFIFDPTGFGTTPNNYAADGARLVNRGLTCIPHGVDWTNNSDSYDSSTPDSIDRVRFVQQAGRMLLGGDFRKTGRNKHFIGQMVFELAGGVLEVTNSVSFYTAESAKDASKGWGDQVFAEMPAGASATVDVKVDSAIDMTPFTYGAGAALVKEGPGLVSFGSSLPPSLTVNGGVVAFAAPTAETEPSTIALGPGYSGDFPLRVWKDSEDAVINDSLDVGEGLSGSFAIRPRCHGFAIGVGEVVRLGPYAAERELPNSSFAGRDWEFCRVAEDPDALYLRYSPAGTMLLVR